MALQIGSANITWPLPASGTVTQQILYRPVGSTSWAVWDTVGPTVNSSVLHIPIGNYEFQIVNNCANGSNVPSPIATFFVCSCPPGYTKNSVGNCQKVSTQSPNTLFSNYCLASSTLKVYSSFFTRVYNTGFSNATIQENVASRPLDVYAQYTTVGQWTSDPNEVYTLNSYGQIVYKSGPMNRAGVWVDSDCNGTKDALAGGTQTTLSFAYNNLGAARRMYVGIAADNLFTLKVNGNEIAKITLAAPQENFKIWHIFPVDTVPGWNYFNGVATGDGTVNDSVGMTIYDVQTPQSFDGIHSGLVQGNIQYNTGLNVLFSSESLIGQHIDISTCDAGYSLDTSAGQGNYICRRIDTQSCN